MVKSNGVKDTWEIDVSTWQTMEQIFEWDSTIRQWDILKIRATLCQVVKVWPHDSDPSKPESYDQLPPMEFVELARKVSNAAMALFRAAAD